MTPWSVIIAAVVAFAGTNIDDVLILVVYFASAAQATDGFNKKHVWIGQTLGFTAIMVISLLGAIAGSFFPPHYTALLGLVPLLMGLWRMRLWCPSRRRQPSESSFEPLPEDPEAPPERQAKDQSHQPNKCMKGLSMVFSVHTLKVALVTFANGSDNIAIYIPLLCRYTFSGILLTTAIFYLLLLVWLLAASAFVSFRKVAELIERHGKYIVPVALVLLGLYILWSGQVWRLV